MYIPVYEIKVTTKFITNEVKFDIVLNNNPTKFVYTIYAYKLQEDISDQLKSKKTHNEIIQRKQRKKKRKTKQKKKKKQRSTCCKQHCFA